MLGSWNVDIQVGKFPQKVASALADLQLVGAMYEPIAYVGSQVVNGTNHAVLAKQVLTTGKDVENVVVMIFNEKDGTVALSGIDRVLEQGGELGGVKIDVKTELDEDAKKAFDDVFGERLGIRVEPRVYLGNQMTKGLTHFIFAETEGVTRNPERNACVIGYNSMTKKVIFSYVLGDHSNVAQLGYAFTWLKKNVALGKPLGEWP